MDEPKVFQDQHMPKPAFRGYAMPGARFEDVNLSDAV
jgi:hypothetical protein